MSTAQLRQTTLWVTSAFGPRILKKTGKYNFHKGTDFGFGSSTPVSSMGAGVVTHAGWGKGADAERGIFVAVAHAPGIGTSYHSLSRATVTEGQSIAMGDTVGFGGKTAAGAEFNHCHQALWLNGIYVNLENYLTPGKVVTVSNDGQVSTGGSKPFDNSTPSTPILAPIEPEETLMKIMRQDGGTIALVGEFTAVQYTAVSGGQAFSIGANTKGYGQTTGLTGDEVQTLLNEARARRATLVDEIKQAVGVVAVDEGKVAATVADAIKAQVTAALAELDVDVDLDYAAIAKAVIDEDHRRSAE